MKRIFIAYGWYGRGNAGDELMKLALKELFAPRNIDLRFINNVDINALTFNGSYVDGIIFGGGSILDGVPNISKDALSVLESCKIPVFYLGVGHETAVHEIHQRLLKIAKVVAFRDKDIPDLVYSLQAPKNENVTRSVLVIPNVEVVPTTSSPHWAHVAWEQYKNEMAQVLDDLIDQKLKPEFLIMCQNSHMDDAWPATELFARMKRRSWEKIIHRANDDMSVCTLMSKFQIVITQRYHGIILAEIAGVRYISLDHHDKLKNVLPRRGVHIPYYGANKAILKNAIQDTLSLEPIIPYRVSHEIYDKLVDRVVASLDVERA